MDTWFNAGPLEDRGDVASGFVGPLVVGVDAELAERLAVIRRDQNCGVVEDSHVGQLVHDRADGVVGVAGVVLWWSSLIIVEVGVPPSSLSSRMKEPWCSDSRTFRFEGVDERDEERVGRRRRNATRSNTGDVAIEVEKRKEKNKERGMRRVSLQFSKTLFTSFDPRD